MKTKLLKKIRKRFSWYINSKGKYILIDKKDKDVLILDMKEALDINKSKAEDIKVSDDEFIFRILKTLMLRPFGYSWADIYNKHKYRRANLILKSISGKKYYKRIK